MELTASDIYERINALRQEGPEAMERESKRILDEFFDSIEDEEKRLRLQQLQFRIDGQLRKYKDPIARMNKMCEIFWEGFAEFQQALNKLTGDRDG